MTPFLRLLWKEYHSLRVLWIGVTLGTLAIWGVGLLSASRDQYRQVDLTMIIWSLAIWLPAVYLLACTSAQFAGEQEERTASWLTHLGAPLRPLFSAKILWTAATAFAMQAILLFAAWRLRLFVNAWFPSGGPLLSDERTLGTTEFATFLLIESLAWGVFWSLQTSSVLRALLCSVVTVVFINLAAAMVWTPRTATVAEVLSNAVWSWGFLRTGLTLGVLVVDCYIARRWLRGHSTTWAIPWERWLPQREAVPRAVAETSVVEPSAPWSRAWQRFRWLEWQSLRGYLMFCALLIVPSLGLLILTSVLRITDVGPPVIPFVSAVFLPMIAGLAAWRGEQTREQFRFLISRGISPLALWMNKFVLWFAAVVASIVGLVALGWLLWFVKASLWLPPSSIPLSERMWMEWQRGIFRDAGPSEAAWFVVLLFLGSFTAGLYFRRAIYAAALGLLLTALVGPLIAVNHQLGLPAWLGLAPVAAWLLWCGLRQVPRWALERTGWRTAAVIAAEWLVFPFVFAVAVVAYWVYSVPSPDVDQIFADQTRRRIYQAEWEAHRNQQPFVPADVRETLLAADELTREYAEAQRRAGSLDRLLTAEDWKQFFHPDVTKLRDSLLRANLLPKQLEIAEWPPKGQAWFFVEMLLRDADRALEEGRHEDSIRDLRAAVRVVGALLSVDPPTSASRVSIKQTHADLHARLVAWAQHPQQKPETVAQAIADVFQNDLDWWSPSVLALDRDYRQAVDEIRKQQKEMGLLAAPSAERSRRIQACIFSNRALYLTYFRSLPSPWLVIHRPDLMSLGSTAQNRAWRYRASDRDSVPLGLDNRFLIWSQDLPIRIRCTLGTMAVVAFRAEHGRLPVSFDEVSPEFGPSQWWSLFPQMTELKLQTDGKWPSIPLTGVPDVVPGQDPGVPFVYVRPFVGQSGDPYGRVAGEDANAYVFAVPPPP